MEEKHAAQRVLAGGWGREGREIAALKTSCAPISVCRMDIRSPFPAEAPRSFLRCRFSTRAIDRRLPVLISCGSLTNQQSLHNLSLPVARPHLAQIRLRTVQTSIPGKLQRSAAAIAIIPHIRRRSMSPLRRRATASSSSTDCAQALGGELLTAFCSLASPAARSGAFSFYVTNMIATSGGQGGMLARAG